MKQLVFTAALASLLLAGCAGKKEVEAGDGPSSRKISAADVHDAVPKDEPRARYGNHSPYTVLGKSYTVLPTSKGYHERGVASWYGSKFHGRRTSSGELYDMHLATAAHKSLPLPTFAEVTNLDNGRKMIVKINDRGPFHEDRIIDLSYAAAIKLGVDQTGTARIDVRTIDVKTSKRSAVKLADGTFLQVGAFSKRKTADDLAGKMMAAQLKPVSIQKSRGLYKVWIGPYASESEIEASMRRVVELGYERPHKVSR
ncbi:MAG: septal ring lytic transglycosylase RlpA family protein [Xanthomonadales bacterium]|nr:septal ring lytic transglycosylase RlpA family protein [Xanthomonadales bacterium]